MRVCCGRVDDDWELNLLWASKKYGQKMVGGLWIRAQWIISSALYLTCAEWIGSMNNQEKVNIPEVFLVFLVKSFIFHRVS